MNSKAVALLAFAIFVIILILAGIAACIAGVFWGRLRNSIRGHRSEEVTNEKHAPIPSDKPRTCSSSRPKVPDVEIGLPRPSSEPASPSSSTPIMPSPSAQGLRPQPSMLSLSTSTSDPFRAGDDASLLHTPTSQHADSPFSDFGVRGSPLASPVSCPAPALMGLSSAAPLSSDGALPPALSRVPSDKARG
ncbi:hypothetical protein K488DRAFT_74362 [Vararia minispora EC-137]|uniref:Uncharacterized protein n=1 Tax=Vararia minispora EC-137 TaxID=1314806 RepID=A0ACB8Q7B9_9AGAM|nr:hypothetical protein K488DRAFT_74362 [Vararia minispora EC-137]